MLPYLVHVGTVVAIYLIVALSYSITVGYVGLLNLGQVGLLGVGAYAAAILTTRGYSFWLALPAAAAVTGGVGYLLALPSRRIKGDYYALMTLGFVFVANAVLLNWTSLTRGPFGIWGIRRPSAAADPAAFFGLAAVLCAAVAAFVYRLTRSPFGQALEAVRDDDLVAESLGKPTGKLRVVALTVSAVLVGLAGALLAAFLQFLNPALFWLDSVVWVLAWLVVGGLASFRGTIIGTLALYLIFEPLRFLSLPPGLTGSLRLIIFSLALLLVVLFRPKGFAGRAQLWS